MNKLFTRIPGPLLLSIAGMILMTGAGSATAQQSVTFEGGYPVAPQGLANQPLPDGPMEFATAEGQDIRVVVVTRELEYPHSMAFLPDGAMLVAERAGRIRIIRNGVLDPRPVSGGPEAFYSGIPGLPGAVHGYMNLALHPRFADNRLLYLSYTKPAEAGVNRVAIARGRFSGNSLRDVSDVLVLDEGTRGATPIVFGVDGKLYIGASGGDSQNPRNLGGKVLRINDDGSIPADNPFADRAGYRPEIYTLGHRNALGIAVHPGSGKIWISENGPNGGDELNVIEPGRNYGWPIVSLGRTYQGPWQSERPTHADYEPPVVYWMPAIAVSGLAFYTGDRLPKWTGDVFVGGLRTGEIPGTGHVERILFNEKMEELRRESLLVELRQRIRDVKQGPDGLLYLATDEQAGAVLRIEPLP